MIKTAYFLLYAALMSFMINTHAYYTAEGVNPVDGAQQAHIVRSLNQLSTCVKNHAYKESIKLKDCQLELARAQLLGAGEDLVNLTILEALDSPRY